MYKTQNEIQNDRTFSSKGQIKYKLATTYPSINQPDSQRDKEKEEAFIEDISLIQNLWEDLGVQEQYKGLFETMARQLEGKARKEFLDYENQSLKRMREHLNVSKLLNISYL